MALPAPVLLVEPASLDRFTFAPLLGGCWQLRGLGTVRTLTAAAAQAFMDELRSYGWQPLCAI